MLDPCALSPFAVEFVSVEGEPTKLRGRSLRFDDGFSAVSFLTISGTVRGSAVEFRFSVLEFRRSEFEKYPG